jgi:hypothetical protein
VWEFSHNQSENSLVFRLYKDKRVVLFFFFGRFTFIFRKSQAFTLKPSFSGERIAWEIQCAIEQILLVVNSVKRATSRFSLASDGFGDDGGVRLHKIHLNKSAEIWEIFCAKLFEVHTLRNYEGSVEVALRSAVLKIESKVFSFGFKTLRSTDLAHQF